jgi:hypothetical protein
MQPDDGACIGAHSVQHSSRGQIRQPEARVASLSCAPGEELSTLLDITRRGEEKTYVSLYEVFPPSQAKALADRLEIHYTLKHASWLNIAEIELSVLARQGLAHNIATIEELCQQVQSWQDRRNQRGGTVNWQFRTADARIKLKRLYPVQQPDGL